jgi:hypothetical protein
VGVGQRDGRSIAIDAAGTINTAEAQLNGVTNHVENLRIEARVGGVDARLASTTPAVSTATVGSACSIHVSTEDFVRN